MSILSDLLLSLARWPMRSPMRFWGSLAGLVAAFIMAASMWGAANREDEPPAAEGTETASATPAAAATSSTPAASGSASPAELTDEQVEASRKAAVHAVTEWGKRDRSPEEWQAVMKPLVTERYAQTLKWVDPRRDDVVNVQEGATAQAETDVGETGKNADVVYSVPTDHGLALVALVAEGERWLVDELVVGEGE